jgi:cell wall assembly regulator SMI1
LRPAAGGAAVTAAAQDLGFAGTGLDAWWGAHNGSRDRAGQILPGFTPYGIGDMLASRDGWLAIAADVWDDEARGRGAAQPAGGPAWAFDERFVPIGTNGAGDDLVVDLRPGPRRGCVKEYYHQEGALTPPVFAGLDELLAAVLDAVRAGTPVLRRTPVVVDGVLSWR